VPGSGIPFGLLKTGQVADEEDDVAGVDVGADGPVGLAGLEEHGDCFADRAQAVRGQGLRHARLDGGEDSALDARVAGHPVEPASLLKHSTADDFTNAIRTVHDGEFLLFPAAVRRLATRRGGRGRGLAEANLTDREAEVLRLIAQGRSNSEIAGDLFLGVETVKTHVRNVLAKLGARDRVQAVITAYESGFIR